MTFFEVGDFMPRISDRTPCSCEYKRMIFGLIVLATAAIFLRFIKEEWFGGNQYLFYLSLAVIGAAMIASSFTIAFYYQCLTSYNKTGNSR